MVETPNSTKSRKAGLTALATASMLLGVLGLAVIAWRLLAYRPWWSEYVARNVIGLLGIVGLILGYVALARISKRIASITALVLSSPLLILWCAFILMGPLRSRLFYGFMWMCSSFLTVALLALIFSALSTPRWKSWLKGKTRSGTLATLGILASVFLMRFWWIETCGPASTALANVCAHNLKRLGDAMKVYSNDNQGRYPDPDRWCDLLLQHARVDADRFLCPAVKWEWRRQVFPFPVPKNRRCYYAMNPNCKPNSPDDVVFLFEIEGGWNKTGGSELMTAENHTGPGSVLLHGGDLPAEEFAKLNWGAGEENE